MMHSSTMTSRSVASMKNLTGINHRTNLSFAGCGFLGIYHVGAACCFKKYAPHLYEEKIAGASAGALVACALISGCCLGECTTFTLKLATQARSRVLGPLSPSFTLVKNLRQALQNFLPDNAHELASGRLHISLTRLSDQQNVLVSEFASKDELMDALICSSYVPLYSGIVPPKYRGVRYVDGAVSDNMPVLDDNTVTISPFAGESDICPEDNSCNFHHIKLAGTSVQLTADNLYRASVAFFPPNPEILSNMCKQGFEDALRFLRENKLITCDQHLQVTSNIISDRPMDDINLFDDGSHTSEPMILEGVSNTRMEFLEEDDYESDDAMSVCEECQRMEQFAMADSPPAQVQTALQAACDEVNKGFLANLYKTKLYRAVSLLATPYFLPFELTYSFIRKLYDWGPYIPEDLQWFIGGLYDLLIGLISSKSSEDPSNWALAYGGYLGVQSQPARRKKSSRAAPADLRLTAQDGETPSVQTPRHSHHHPPQQPTTEHRSINLNVGINIGNNAQSPLVCIRQARDHLLDDQHRLAEAPAAESHSRGVTWSSGPDDDSISLAGGSTPAESCNNTYDSFENYLHVAKQMESIIAYYYMEESNPTKVRVVEIFPLHPLPGKPVSNVPGGH